jgi:hypothetical protein
METSVTGHGTLVFWWKAFCSTNVNFGRFFVDGVEQMGKISGQTDWQPQSFYVPGGAHALRWNYTNNTATVSLNPIWKPRSIFLRLALRGTTCEVHHSDFYYD